jgi:hypothetical protein
MPRKAPPARAEPTCHAELDQLRQAVAREHARVREEELELQRAKAAVENVSARLKEAYAADNEKTEKTVQTLRKQLEKAEAAVVELGQRIGGARIRPRRTSPV